MSTLLRAEILKQRTTRMVPVVLATSLAIGIFALFQIIDTAGVRGAPSLGTLAHTRQIIGVPVLASLPLLVLGVMSVTTEHRHHTITSTSLAEPRRWRVVVSKVLVASGVAFACALVAVTVVNALAIPLLAKEGVDHLAMMTPTLWSAIGASLVAATVLRLAEEGVLSVDDRLDRWVEEPARFGDVTLRQLLGHTSGVPEYTASGDFFEQLDRAWTPDQMIDSTAGQAPLFEPGTDWQYSNTNYILLGQVIEAATGRPLR